MLIETQISTNLRRILSSRVDLYERLTDSVIKPDLEDYLFCREFFRRLLKRISNDSKKYRYLIIEKVTASHWKRDDESNKGFILLFKTLVVSSNKKRQKIRGRSKYRYMDKNLLCGISFEPFELWVFFRIFLLVNHSQRNRSGIGLMKKKRDQKKLKLRLVE